MCIRESSEKNTRHKLQLIEVVLFYPQKIYHYNLCPRQCHWRHYGYLKPVSASDGIDGGTGCNFIYLFH